MATYNESAEPAGSLRAPAHNFDLGQHGREEARRLLDAWNETRQQYSYQLCVPQLVAACATVIPGAVALVAGDHVLTYGELNERANRLAHYLRAHGVGPEVLVGLCLDRSLELVVALLGILKAGGAYVPLDPAYPPARLAAMLTDAAPPVLLTQQRHHERLPSEPAQGPHVCCVDRDAALLAGYSAADPPPLATPDHLAYVIYTSGSSGQPKGVEITHRSLLNLIFWHQSAFEVTPADRATQVAGPAFDATGWELWPYLTTGASVYIADDDTRVTPSALRDWLLAQEITICFLPTALAEAAMTLEWPSTTALRLLLTGADTLHRYPPAGLPFALINNYGPTESTVVATSGRVCPAEGAATLPSIGRPIANTQIYILDDHAQRAPIGTPGELHIGGIGLARGYLRRPDLSAEKFIPHPFSPEPGARLYKTGDLACYQPDGCITFLGRIDDQVKIRGYRIEPAEIAAVLDEHPAVQSSAVVAREDMRGDPQLVAYIVPRPHMHVTLRSLRECLESRLPSYMIPATFVLVDALPLTANGKIDHAALPSPEMDNIMRNEAIVAPSTSVEERVAGIVATLLRREQVGVDDDFFMLGGHSLLGTQLIARVAEAYGVDVSLRSLFEAPTVRQLSAEIERLILAAVESLSDEDVEQLLT